MADPIMFNKKVLAAKTETTPGTYESLTASDAGFRVQNAALAIRRETMERFAQGDFRYTKGVPQDISTELTFQHHIAGKGTSGVPLWASTFLPSCGMAFDTDTFTTTSDTDDWETISAGLYQDGRLKKGRGMMGSFVIELTAGRSAEINFTYLGGYEEQPAAGAMLTGITYAEAQPPIWAGSGSLSVGASSDFKVARATIDRGFNVALREDPNKAGGYWGGWGGTPTPTLRMDPEAMAFATKNWYASQDSGEELDITFTLNGGGDNTIVIVCNDCQLSEAPSDEERNGKLVDALGFRINGEIEIEFTPAEA